MKNIFYVFAASLITISAKASQQIPAQALNVINNYVANHCKYASEFTLEETKIVSFDVDTLPGYVDSFKKVEVEMTMLYGNDDSRIELMQTLTLQNATGKYRIIKASGPCETIISDK